MNSTLSTRETLMNKVAEQLSLSVDVVEKIVGNQFKQANKAFKEYNEIEISGFGKFLQSQHKIAKRIKRGEVAKITLEKLLSEAETQEKVIYFTKRLEDLATDMAFYRSKLKPEESGDKYKGHVERMEESSTAIS